MKVFIALFFGMFLQPILAFECAVDRPFSEQVSELKKMIAEKPEQVSKCSQALINSRSLVLKPVESLQLKLVLIEEMIRQSDFKGGLKLAKQLLNDDAFNNNLALGVDLYRWLGVAYGRTGVNDKSIEAFQVMLAKATQLENEELIAAAENNLGATYLKMGDYPLALSYFQKVLNNVPEGWGDTRLAILHENIGVVFAWTEQHEEAVRAYQLALDSAAKSKAATGLILTNMASSYMKLGHLDLAAKAINKALIDAEKRSNRFVNTLALFVGAEIKLDNLETGQALTDLK
ncbi:MAG: tetratricopeptide repeat protein [bacterium]